MNSEEPAVLLGMGEIKTSVRFAETHYHDIKTILGSLVREIRD